MKQVYTKILSYDPRYGVVTAYPDIETVITKLFGSNPPQNAKEDLLKSIKTKSKLWGYYFNAQTELR